MDWKIRSVILLSCAVFPAIASWQSPVRWRRLLQKAVPGTLTLSETGVEFHSQKFSHKWLYEDVRTFELAGGKDLTLTDYENRHWHEPGDRTFHFTLAQPMPPDVAADFARRVQRPVINGDPEPAKASAAIAELPAHRRERFGGSNGTLRFRDDGIDYIDATGRDGRSWRWSDIQTLANPDPWNFRVTGYREIVEFDLKQPLAPEVFDRLWDHLYAADLNVATPHEVHHQ